MKIIDSDANFMNDDFLLQNVTAKKLYHQYAAKMPIVDYHNHLSAEKIAKNIGFKDVTEAWLAEDHYKWRGMRANGIDEKYITGNASPIEKFKKWAETVPYTIKNPLFHWTHLELKKYFGITDILQPSNCEEIFNKTSAILRKTTPQDLLLQANVKLVCTTDDPTDNLKWHMYIANNNYKIKVLPTFRSDNIINIEADNFVKYIKSLSELTEIKINDLASLKKSLQKRINFFDSAGCKLSDYGLTGPFIFNDFDEHTVDGIVKKRLSNQKVSIKENHLYRSCVLYTLSTMYAEKEWVQQFHLGPIRNNNSRLIASFGTDAGCDSIGDYTYANQLSSFFNKLEINNKLAKTITYNLNPAYNEVFATMMGNFNTGGIPAKMQWGAAWWFLDQKNGIEKQLQTLSDIGLLSRFVGMLTDSRSFLSFSRHEYFRRILCNVIGKDVENGEIPKDIVFLGKMVQDICYHNAINYFKF